MSMGQETMVSVRVYLYGDHAASAADVSKQKWESWLADLFPPKPM
jgi:hypothetical protein